MKLRYKIISHSSQDPNAPITNLISNSGCWQSTRFCDYPQQITLQFYEPVAIKEFSIVSHPSKISSRITILFCLPDRNKPNEGYKFEKYGYVEFSQNEATQYQCRECKKIIDVNENVLYMRLILWKNHQNAHNFFNQVGLSQVNVYGSSYITAGLPALQNRSLLNSLSTTQYIESKVQLLEQFKQEFTKEDDFESAKQIKQIIKVIKLQGERLKELDSEKKSAVVAEKYDRAKKIKEEMDLIKTDVDYLSNNFYDPNKKLIRPVLKDSKLKIKIHELIGQSSQQESLENSHVIKKSPLNDVSEEVESEHQQSDQEQENEYLTENKNSRVSYDNRILPAILHKNKKDIKEILKSSENLEDAAYEDNQFIEKNTKHEDQVAEELNPADEANASIAIEVYGKQTIKKLYSKNWNLKMEAITEINQESQRIFGANDNYKNAYKAGIFVFNRCMKEGSFPILNLTMEFMNKLLVNSQRKDQNAMAQLRQQIHNELEKSINELFMKMGENQKVKQISQSILKNMLKTQLYGLPFVYHTIHKSYSNPMFTSSSKIKKYKLGSVETMLLQCGLGGKGGLPMSSIDFVSKAAEDANGDVRKEATLLLKLMKERGGGQKVVEAVRSRQSVKGSIVKQLEK